MGVVYRARDTELGRDVAVKVLNDASAAKPSRIEAFGREARAVARLSHPNILDIHDFGVHEGITYSVTELLQGKTLADRLLRGPIPLNKGLKICRDVAEGLAAAHGESIVHRDIKPSNIFITNTGHVKILDFGIARLRERPTGESSDESSAPTDTLTGARGMVGTVGYMSPEQIDGNPVDGRSDIFGLGCVMYEILTGTRAFQGKTATDTMLAILGKDPVRISTLRPEVPQSVEAIVERCLEKQPGERFESARDVAFALRAVSGQERSSPPVRLPLLQKFTRPTLKAAAVAVVVGLAMVLGAKLANIWPSPPPQLPDDKHVAIIPFEAEGGSAELVQFATGMSEILAEDLEFLENRGIGRFWTVPPGDARYMGASTVDQMYRTFNVNVVLTGALDRRGTEIRLALGLIEPKTGRVIRSRIVEADLGNVSSLQLDPIVGVTELLDLEVSPEILDRLAENTTNVAQAFELYARGFGVLSTSSDETSTSTAIELLEDAVRRDPLLTPAREILARAFIRKQRETGVRVWYDRAHDELQWVLRNSPSEFAYRALGDLFIADGEVDLALAPLKRAVELAPESAATYFKLGRTFERLGRPADAERAYQRATNLRPGYWPGPNRLATLYYSEGRYDAAANAWRQATQCAPLCSQGYNNLGAVYSRLDLQDEAQAMFEKSIEVEPDDNYLAYSNLGSLYDQAARFTDAVQMFEKALTINDSDYLVWANLGYALSFGAEPERAREPLERAVELAEQRRALAPGDVELLSRLAGYYVMLEDHDTGRTLLEQTIALSPADPVILAKIGETYEDLGDRDQALVWIGRALEAGTLPHYFEQRPMFRDLVADERYRQIVEQVQASGMELEDPSRSE